MINDKCKFECKELIDKGRFDNGFIWNHGKSYNIDQYLDYKNCKCGEKLIDKLVEECSGNNIIHSVTLNDYGKVCKSCTINIVLLIIIFSQWL